ncbi:MAG: hydroxylamine reductase [Armatimonadetes bacterium]|nr:hydroxylamine reductase [Armatimonadota bacterium]
MFCYQCEQTWRGTGCTRFGVCGKDPETAALQDLLVYGAQGLALYAHRARQLGIADREIDIFTLEALFTTVTNVNFDAERLAGMVGKLARLRDRARSLYEEAYRKQHGEVPAPLGGPAAWTPATTLEELVAQGEAVGITQGAQRHGADVNALVQLVLYGLKGMAAYADHAHILGYDDDSVFAFVHEALATLAGDKLTVPDLLALALKVGEMNLKVMALLDAANTDTYGHPVPTRVRVTPVKGKAILVSGHDLKDLALLLEQTQGKGINVYTHGEMLPAHGYPKLKQYPHLVGNYGSAWQNQEEEFAAFPGAILMTTNCIQAPAESYQDRLFTTGLVAWPGVRHVADKDFTPVIEAALAAEGFAEDAPAQEITVGFGHHTVLGVADTVIEAVKSGAIRHFFLIGGCDGARDERGYYTELAEKVPQDCVILTLACGKYRFNKLPFGEIGGLPRLLDLGQCNDAYSAIKIAQALADAFGVGVNDLPLSLVLSWYEQKAVAILLTLLHLGIRGIRLGPSLPAFLTPSILQALVENFGITPTTTADEDLSALLGAA